MWSRKKRYFGFREQYEQRPENGKGQSTCKRSEQRGRVVLIRQEGLGPNRHFIDTVFLRYEVSAVTTFILQMRKAPQRS